MKLYGVFSWYDESPSWLGTAIASLGRFCDHIIAVDGAYALYPGGSPRSHPQQAETILHTAEAAAIACTLYQPQEVWWENEVEKRNKALDIVGAFAVTDEDWICVFDADYHVLRCNPDSLKGQLIETDLDVATYGMVEGEDWLATEQLAETAAKSKLDTQWTGKIRDLYRWHPTLRVGPAHGDYSDERYATRRWLRGPYDLIPALDVSRELAVYHRTKDRALTRQTSQQDYYKMRDLLGVEEVVTA